MFEGGFPTYLKVFGEQVQVSDYIAAVLLGVVEGVFEFLPLSSTAHLMLVGRALGQGVWGSDFFYLCLQVGAAAALIWHFRLRLVALMWTRRHNQQQRMLAINVAVAFVPSLVAGLCLYKLARDFLSGFEVMAFALLGGGVVLILAEVCWVGRGRCRASMEHLWPPQALRVGLYQVLALVPGVSRSAATIVGGLSVGLTRRAAVEFSFLLAIPTLLSAAIYECWRVQAVAEGTWPLLALGVVVAFITACSVLRALLFFVSHYSLIAFGLYRLALGLAILWWIHA